VGSVLCGTAAFIQQARRVRKMLGGGMRQVGVLAAAGLIALEQMTTRLIEDHERARRLAAGLAALPGICFELGLPQTNMVFPSLADGVTLSGAEFVARLAAQDILIGLVAPRRFRLVTHYWIDDESVDRTIAAFRANLV
jgi:threonine aldolase